MWRVALSAGLWLDAGGVSASQLDAALPIPRPADFDGFRIFIYDLPAEFNVDLQAGIERLAQAGGSNCDFMLSACTENVWTGSPSASRQRGMEVIVLRKLLASPVRTSHPHEANLFVVPYFIGLDCLLGGFNPGCPRRANANAGTLFARLPYYTSATRHQHLFLASADLHSVPLQLQSQLLVISKGAAYSGQAVDGHTGHFVVPTACTDVELQPRRYRDLGLDSRDILFWIVQTPYSLVRWEVQRQLLAYSAMVPESERSGHLGARFVRVVTTGRAKGLERGAEVQPPLAAADVAKEMRRAVFCPAPPTETSGGMKRFIDSILAGCLPVVVAFGTALGSGISWWKRHGAPVEWSLPFPWAIDWRRLAVEVPVEVFYAGANSWPLVQACLSLTRAEVESKRRYLLQVRGLLLYDLTGGTRDAFSLLMEGVRMAVARMAPLSRSSPLVCDLFPRSWIQWRMPEEMVGAGVGTDKQWDHSFASTSCAPAHLWRPPVDYWAVHDTALPKPTLTLEQYVPARMGRTREGMAVFWQTRIASDLPAPKWREVMLTSALTVCQHAPAPRACHDVLDEHGVAYGECANLEPGIPPNTTCRLLPSLVPHVPPAALGRGPGPHVEVVSAVCDDSAREWAFDDGPYRELGGSAHAVLYSACTPPPGTEAHVGETGAAFQRRSGKALIDHVLATIYAMRRGAVVADRLLLVRGSWWDDGSPNGEGQALHRPHMDLGGLLATSWRRWAASEGLVVFSGPAGESNPCDAHELTLTTPCGLAADDVPAGPVAMAFPTEVLDHLIPSDLEMVSASVDLFEEQDHSDEHRAMGVLYALVARAARRGGLDIVFEDFRSFAGARASRSDADVCIEAFLAHDYDYAGLSGMAVAALPGDIALRTAASECAAKGGNYALWRTKLNESSHEASWSSRGVHFREFLGSLQYAAEEWLYFEHFGICVPSMPACAAPNAIAGLGWHMLVRMKFGLPDFLASLPPPSAIDVSLWPR